MIVRHSHARWFDPENPKVRERHRYDNNIRWLSEQEQVQ